MFIFSKEKRAKRSSIKIINKLEKITKISLGNLVNKLHSGGYNASWKDIDRRLSALVDKLTYSLNDDNIKTADTLLKYIEKLIDSRIGFSNYYEQLKDPVEEQLQECDILMSEDLDRADKAFME